jgi:hypothetical protein
MPGREASRPTIERAQSTTREQSGVLPVYGRIPGAEFRLGRRIPEKSRTERMNTYPESGAHELIRTA